MLTVAGSDSGGGAGVQADLKTAEACSAFATSAITAVTAQHTRGVESTHVLPLEEISTQIEAVRGDFAVDALKIGMLATEPVIELVADHAADLAAPTVVDPVMVATSGDRLLDPEAEGTYKELLAHATLATPNAEETLADDPPLRMLQIFVRPHSLDLDPGIQHESIPEPTPNEWRHLFGPEGSGAPACVRNDVDCFDCRLDAGETRTLPGRADWDSYVYVFDGAIEVGGEAVGYTESALVTGEAPISATESSTVVAFSINPDAPVTRQGTIGR